MGATRRDFLTGSAVAVAAAIAGRVVPLAAWPQRGQGQAPPVTPVFTPLRRDVGFFTGRGGTIGYLINPGGVVVVDSQFPDAAALCLAGLNERSGNRPIDWLINTHHHGDHTAGNIVFKGVAKKVAAHVRAAEHMRQPPGRQAQASEQLYPDTTFETTFEQTIGGETVRAKHYGRAHTGGDAVITFTQANVAHMGDLMFNRRHPVVDRPAGATLEGWIGVLEQTANEHTPETVYIFGHAGANIPVTGSRADLLHFRDYLTALLQHVRREVAAGRTEEEILAVREPLAGFPDHGPLNATILRNAYQEVAGS
ncbi:MAG TPA: MBL fold metallo-hydrolase [Vicinamibacterales bacterium]|nr:MBL fold metallo-hydrolase [Vicinamibacterales bacterium]